LAERRPCANGCGRLEHAGGRCATCNQFWKRNGFDPAPQDIRRRRRVGQSPFDEVAQSDTVSFATWAQENGYNPATREYAHA